MARRQYLGAVLSCLLFASAAHADAQAAPSPRSNDVPVNAGLFYLPAWPDSQAALAVPAKSVSAIALPDDRLRHSRSVAESESELRALRAMLISESGHRTPTALFSRGGGEDCASAVVITEADLPFQGAGSTCDAADDYNETCPLPGTGGRDVVYAFTPSSDLTVDISLCGSTFDTKLYVYTGTCPDIGNPLACNEDACGADGFKSHLTNVSLTGGETSYIVIDGFDGTACGDYILEVAPSAPVSPGNDCSDPIVVNVPADLDFLDANTTCGRGDDYDNTCMGAFDGGEDIIYELDVSAETVVNIEVNGATIWLGMALDEWCPPDGASCLATAAGVESPDRIENLSLPAGRYYLMVDTFPEPQCAAFSLSITRAPLGACCIEGVCHEDYELECIADGGAYAGDGSTCTDSLCLFGACCLPDGGCTDGISSTECEASGGRYRSHGSSCGSISCPQPGDNCHLPLRIELPAQLPYTDAGQTTCGRGNDYVDTCLDPMDRGEDIIYEVNVTSDVCVTVQLQDASVVWSGVAIGHSCPLEPEGCLGVSATTNLIDRITRLYLPVGTYYIMVDSFPDPDCTPEFSLKITASTSCTTGACCFRSTCSEEYEEACTSAGGLFLGAGTNCADSPCANGACCQTDGSCAQTAGAAACDGTFQGHGTSCESSFCSPQGDSCETALEIPAVPTSFVIDNTSFGAHRPGASCDPYGSYALMQNDVWYRWTAETDGIAVVDVAASGYNMVTVVWEGEDCNNLVEADCANSGTTSGNTEQAIFEVQPGRTYWIQIGDTGPNAHGGPTTVDISVTAGSGACCNPTTGGCTEGTLLECAAVDGVYQGNGSTCAVGLCPQPPADTCGDAPSFAEVSDLPFDTSTATAEGSNLPCTTGVNRNLWYCYTPSQTGMATISLCGSGYDTVLAVYKGCTCLETGSPEGELIACNDDNCSLASAVTIPVLVGESYLVEIGGYDGAAGPGLLNISIEDGVTGACCLGDEPGCVEVHAQVCGLLGGSHAGNGTTCSGDIDNNGTPDACDPDCNENGIIDGCDVSCDFGCSDLLMCGQSFDCQQDLVPDECQLGNDLIYTYQWDDGSLEVAVGVAAGGYTGVINRFIADEGSTRIGGVSVAWGEVPNGTPATVYLWSDPNGDGNPTDARVLASAATTVTAANSSSTVTIKIPVTDIGPAGTSFFVGAIVPHAEGEKPGALDNDEDTTPYGQSWIVGDTSSPIDPNNLGAAQGPPANVNDIMTTPGNWMIRAKAAGPDNDCNDNFVPDDCDIALVPSLDCNTNGVIDWCESGDCNGNAIPDVCDVLEGDCNANGVPDFCDVLPDDPDGDGQISEDCQPDLIPDECQLGGQAEAVIVLEEGFEGGVFPPAGWENVALDNLGPWAASTNPDHIHSGIRSAVHPYAPATSHGDSYLLSPVLELSKARLSIWTKGCAGQTWCDAYDVDILLVVGAPGGDDDVFVGNLNALYVDYFETWVEGAYDLTPLLPDGPFRVAIRYRGIDGDVGMIDDLTVFIPAPPQPNDQDGNGVPDECDGWRGDDDRDGDVDLADFAGFQRCFGPAPIAAECAIFDYNADGDVDLVDLNGFVTTVSGPEE